MAKAIITFKIMPESPEVDLAPIKEHGQKVASEKGALGQILVLEEPIAFGLKAVLVKAMYNLDNQDFDSFAAEMAKIEGVQSCEVAGMDLALG